MSEAPKKKPEPDDPMELRGVVCDGDPDFMFDCLVEEYARLGWGRDEIMELFASPLYPMLHRFYQSRGAAAVRHKVEAVLRRCGVFRSRTAERPQAPPLVHIEPGEQGGEER